jgi:hypothetical protein
MPATEENNRARGERQIISSKEETRAAIAQITSLANRGLAILTPDLEPDIYDHDEFLETLKRFILARTFARVRVLVSDPTRALKNGNRFVDMARRLNSYIEFRNLKPEFRHRVEAFCVADDHAIVYRANADRWEGMSDTHSPAVARKYLEQFDQLWNASEVESQLRQLNL